MNSTDAVSSKIASKNIRPKSLSEILSKFAKLINYECISSEDSRQKYKFTFSSEDQRKLIDEAVEFQYIAKAPKGMKTINDDGTCNIAESQKKLMEDLNMTKDITFKKAILDGLYSTLFAKIKSEDGSITSEYRVSNNPEKEDEYILEFDKIKDFPEIDFSKLNLEEYNNIISDEDIEKEIQAILDSQNYLSETLDQSQIVNQDSAVEIDFIGSICGKMFEGGSAKNFSVSLGQEKMLPDFEAGIVGMKVGETKNIQVKFPENYGQKTLAGLNADFKITCNKILEEKKFDKIEQFLEKNNIKDLNTLKSLLKNEIELNSKVISWEVQKNNIIKKLCEIVEFEVPEFIIEDGIKREKEQDLKAAVDKVQKRVFGMEAEPESTEVKKQEDIDKLREDFKENIKLALLFESLAKKYNIEATEQDKSDEIIKQARIHKIPINNFIDIIEKQKPTNIINTIIRDSREKAILRFIISKANIEKIDKTYSQIKDLYNDFFQ